MADASHVFGSDIALGPTGDIAIVDGDSETQQRIIRRLLTVAGAYIQQLGYGAGIGARIGSPVNAAQLQGLIRKQMKQEASVAQSPPPTILVTSAPGGLFTITVGYTIAATGLPAPKITLLPAG